MGQITEIPTIQGLESVLKALKFGALHCLLILCVGILPVAGFAAVDELHHPGGGCVECEIGPTGKAGDCGAEFCAGAASSCGSHHGLSMITGAPTSLPPAIAGGVGATRGSDDFGPPPPSRIDRPPIT